LASAIVYFDEGGVSEAIALLNSVFQLVDKLAQNGKEWQLPLDHPYRITASCTLSEAYLKANRPQEAVVLLKPIYEFLMNREDAAPQSVLQLASVLTRALKQAGAANHELNPIREKQLAIFAEIGEPQHKATWLSRHELAWHRDMDQGRPETAIKLFEQNLLAASSPHQKATTLDSIADCHMRMGDDESALPFREQALNVLTESRGPNDGSWQSGMIRVHIGETLQRIGRQDEAEGHLIKGFAELVDNLQAMPPWDLRRSLKCCHLRFDKGRQRIGVVMVS
jgi:tetratricopeptide (TPR) repeat protein